MPSINNGSGTTVPTIDYNSSIVQVTQNWGDFTSWITVPYLVCNRLTRELPPQIGHAVLTYRTGDLLLEQQQSDHDIYPISLLGLYVRVLVQYPQSDPVSVFYGIIEDQKTTYLQDDIPSGDQVFTAHSIEYVLDRAPIDGAVGSKATPQSLQDQGGPPMVTVTLHSPWAFNRRPTKGFEVIGNRSKTVAPESPVTSGPGAVYTFSSDGALWSNADICAYLFQYFGPSDTNLNFQIVGLTQPLTQTKVYHDFHSHERQASTVWNALCRLIDHKKALTFSTIVDDNSGQIYLYVNSTLDFPIQVGALTIPPNQNQVTFSLPDEEPYQHLVDDLPLTMTNKNQFGTIEVYGAKIKVMAPFVFDGDPNIQAANLQHGGAYLKMEYDNAAAVPKVNGQQDPSACDRYREKPKYTDVYQKFTVPQGWDGTDGQGNNWLPIALDDGSVTLDTTQGEAGYDGQNDTQQVSGGSEFDAPGPQFMLFDKHFDRTLPIRAGVDYTQNPPMDSNPIPALAQYIKLQVWYEDISGGGIHATDGLWHDIEKFHEDNSKVKNLTGHPTDKDLGVHIEAKPNHYLGLNSFTGTTLHDPELDFVNLMVLGSFDVDERIVCRWYNQNDNGRIKTEYVNSARYVYAVPGCPLQISSKGTLTLFNPKSTIIHNDQKVLQQILAEMVAWYGRPRQCVEINIKQPGLFVDVGCFLTEVDTAFSVEPIGTLINSITIDFDRQTTRVSTGWSDLDFVKLMGRSEDLESSEGDLF